MFGLFPGPGRRSLAFGTPSSRLGTKDANVIHDEIISGACEKLRDDPHVREAYLGRGAARLA